MRRHNFQLPIHTAPNEIQGRTPTRYRTPVIHSVCDISKQTIPHSHALIRRSGENLSLSNHLTYKIANNARTAVSDRKSH
jgi:hypothetical protein